MTTDDKPDRPEDKIERNRAPAIEFGVDFEIETYREARIVSTVTSRVRAGLKAQQGWSEGGNTRSQGYDPRDEDMEKRWDRIEAANPDYYKKQIAKAVHQEVRKLLDIAEEVIGPDHLLDEKAVAGLGLSEAKEEKVYDVHELYGELGLPKPPSIQAKIRDRKKKRFRG